MLFESFPQADLCKILSTVLNCIDYVVLITDSDGKFLFVNKASLQISNTTSEEWIGKTPAQMVESGYYVKTFIPEAISSGKAVSGLSHDKRNNKPFMTNSIPILSPNGSVKYVVTLSMSVDRFNELAAQLKDSKERETIYLKEIEILRTNYIFDNEAVFASKEMQSLYSTIVEKIAPVDCTVLITGESGVGKDMIAKTIHQKSPRKDGPFIPICVPSISPNLLESELFGYEGGAFTGSSKKGKPGLIEIANGGTLFLDEVGDIPLDLQVKLLRVLDTHEFIRVGSVKAQKIDCRIIAATNKDIFRMAATDQFREDLLYRLSVINLRIKPLRERVDDIIPLAEHFLNEINKKYKYKKNISSAGYKVLKSYAWLGNVRELRNIIERLCILNTDDIISDSEIINVLGTHMNSNKNFPSTHSKTILDDYSSFEREKIMKALIEASGNKTKAAKILGMSRAKLYRKLAKLNGV
jgi:transcriptional regulator with PAS, ATPase and Fis domain